MFTKTTLIGIGIGAVITAIGVIALITSIGLHTIPIDEKISIGKTSAYQFEAPAHSHQTFQVTGEKFHIKLQTPADGIQADDDYKKEITFDWTVLKDGTNKISIQNSGSTELNVNGTFTRNTDPIVITHNLLVLTAGVIIIGLSGAFSVRRPKGF